MAVRVVFRRQAAADIEAIADQIAQGSPRKAVEVSEGLREQCLSLRDFPERAAPFTSDIRRMVAGSYLIFYRIADPDDPALRRVIVIRVLHGSRDIDRLVDPDDI
jgi:plasmid stabilization system protein ParE